MKGFKTGFRDGDGKIKIPTVGRTELAFAWHYFGVFLGKSVSLAGFPLLSLRIVSGTESSK